MEDYILLRSFFLQKNPKLERLLFIFYFLLFYNAGPLAPSAAPPLEPPTVALGTSNAGLSICFNAASSALLLSTSASSTFLAAALALSIAIFSLSSAFLSAAASCVTSGVVVVVKGGVVPSFFATIHQFFNGLRIRTNYRTECIRLFH